MAIKFTTFVLPASPNSYTTMAVKKTLWLLQVITLLEPLKPFIVILVEVVLLVAAILLYERSQAKKGAAGGDI